MKAAKQKEPRRAGEVGRWVSCGLRGTGAGWEGRGIPGELRGRNAEVRQWEGSWRYMLWGSPMDTGIKCCFGFAIWAGYLSSIKEVVARSCQRLPRVLREPTWGFCQIVETYSGTLHSGNGGHTGSWSPWTPCQMNSS